MRRVSAAVVALMLAGCGIPQPEAFDGFSFRDRSVPMGVISRFDEARFEGAWQVRARIPGTEATDTIRFEDRATGLQMQVRAQNCGSGQACVDIADTLRVTREDGQAGKYLVEMASGQTRRMWVIWVDEGFRTAVIGNPEGSFAWVLDRQASGGADRLLAAREILDFNGYDVSQLRVAE